MDCIVPAYVWMSSRRVVNVVNADRLPTADAADRLNVPAAAVLQLLLKPPPLGLGAKSVLHIQGKRCEIIMQCFKVQIYSCNHAVSVQHQHQDRGTSCAGNLPETHQASPSPTARVNVMARRLRSEHSA